MLFIFRTAHMFSPVVTYYYELLRASK